MWARASVIAAVFAVEPSLQNFTISAAGMRSSKRLGRLELDQRRPREVRAEQHLAVRSLDDRRIGVAERDGPKPHAVLDELVAVGVPDATAGAARDQARRELGKLVVAFRVRVRTAGDEGVCAIAQLESLRRSQMSPQRLLSGFDPPTHPDQSKGPARTAVKIR